MRHGDVVSVKVPRPDNPADAAAVINTGHYGKAYVQFADQEGARRAKDAIHGRLFAGSLVQVGGWVEGCRECCAESGQMVAYGHWCCFGQAGLAQQLAHEWLLCACGHCCRIIIQPLDCSGLPTSAPEG